MNKKVANKSIQSCHKALFLLIFIGGNVQAAPLVDRWALPNGAQVALVSSPGIPMLDIRVDFDAGSRRDPVELAGLASAAALVSQAGLGAMGQAPALDENQVTERWMDLGAQWRVGAGADRLSASLRTLSDPSVLPQAVALAARQLAYPRWETAYAQPLWQRERDRIVTAWTEASTQPAVMAARRFATAVYGTHPYGQEATPQTLARITLADMAAYWQRHVQACHARISLVGDVSRTQAQAIAAELLAGLPKTCTVLPSIPEVAPLPQASHLEVPLPAAQAQVLLGQPGYRRDDPDFLPLLVGNYILGGGGFVSRLTTQVREQRGLSYSVYSYFAPGQHAGAFTVGLQTRPDQAQQALDVARDVVTRFVANGPTEAELQSAKTYLVNSFALRLDTNRKLLDNVANVLWFGLPADYLQTWTQTVQQVSRADVAQAFARVLQPERMVSVVVGGGLVAKPTAAQRSTAAGAAARGG